MGGSMAGAGLMSSAAAKEIAAAKAQMRVSAAIARGMKAIGRALDRESAKFPEPSQRARFLKAVADAAIAHAEATEPVGP